MAITHSTVCIHRRGPKSREPKAHRTPPKTHFHRVEEGSKDTTTNATCTDVSLGSTKFSPVAHPFPGARPTAVAGARWMFAETGNKRAHAGHCA